MSTPGPYASSDEHDTQDTSLEEPRQERDTQNKPARSLKIRNPTRPGGTLSGHAATMGCPSRPDSSRASSSSILQPYSTDKEQGEVEGKQG
jgi:hypothetical protein